MLCLLLSLQDLLVLLFVLQHYFASFFFFNDTATTEIYTLSLHDALPICESGTFDFSFIDADKSNYDTYYEKSLQLIRPGGLIAVDNTLWYGRVADPDVQDKRTQRIRALNEKVRDDKRVTMSLLPVGDGLLLAVKRTEVDV